MANGELVSICDGDVNFWWRGAGVGLFHWFVFRASSPGLNYSSSNKPTETKKNRIIAKEDPELFDLEDDEMPLVKDSLEKRVRRKKKVLWSTRERAAELYRSAPVYSFIFEEH